MIDVPFKTALKASEKRVEGYISVDGVDHTPDDTLVSMQFQATGNLLKSAMTQLDVTLIGDHSSLKDKTFTAYYGAYDGTDYDFVPRGVFNILKAEVSEDKETTKLTAYDNMVLFQKPYTAVSDFPTTLQDFLASMCAGVGVQLSSLSIYNGALSLPEDYWITIPDTTYRDVLNQICEVAVSNARIKADGSLELVPIDNPTAETLDFSNLLDFKRGDKWGGVNSVVLSRQPQNDDIYAQDYEDINYPTTRNLLNLSGMTPSYSENQP